MLIDPGRLVTLYQAPMPSLRKISVHRSIHLYGQRWHIYYIVHAHSDLNSPCRLWVHPFRHFLAQELDREMTKPINVKNHRGSLLRTAMSDSQVSLACMIAHTSVFTTP